MPSLRPYGTGRNSWRGSKGEIAATRHRRPQRPLDDAVRHRLRERLNEWRRVIEGNPAEGNALLRRLLAAKISFRPREDEKGP